MAFKFILRGQVVGINTGAKGETFVKLRTDGVFTFPKADEVAASHNIVLLPEVPTPEGALSMGAVLDIEGSGAVSTHKWEKREFGKTQALDVVKYYFYAASVKLVPKKPA